MSKHTFTVSNGKLTEKVTLSFDVPSGANAFDVDAWRASGLFNPDDSPTVIGSKIIEHVAANATIAYQRAIRSNATDQASAEQVLRGLRLTRSVSVREVPRAVYETFTEAQLEALQSDGTLIVPADK